MDNRIRKTAYSIRDAVRTQLWPIPTVGVVAAVAFGILVPHLDSLIDVGLPRWLDALVFGGDAGAARTVLEAVSGSLITVTSLTFSLTVVTLQLASSQFSPRLLRTFTRDLFVQVTLAIFLATFTYSLTVLRSVRSGDESTAAFVPRVAVTVSFLLALASVFALVFFLSHLTRQIRVETMLENVHGGATETVKANLIRRDATQNAHPILTPPADAVRFVAWKSGFLLRIDDGRLVAVASSMDVFIRIDRSPGSFVVEQTPIARVWRSGAGFPSLDDNKMLDAALRAALHFGPERTAAQDVGYGLRQLVDVAVKALSPGINDPTTASHALGHIAALLSEFAQYRLGDVSTIDADGGVRVGYARPTFADYLELAITQPRHYGGSDPFVVASLLRVLLDLACTVPSEYFGVILSQLQRLQSTADTRDFDSAERTQQAELASEIADAIAARRKIESQ